MRRVPVLLLTGLVTVFALRAGAGILGAGAPGATEVAVAQETPSLDADAGTVAPVRENRASAEPVEGLSATASAARDPRVAALQRELVGFLGRPGWSSDRWSVMVVSLDRGDTLFTLGGDRALAPASNMKLFTSAAGLHFLGPDFRFTTFLMATGPVANGVLDGDLVLYGTGDPTLSSRYGNLTDVWTAFADSLTAAGVREVRGDVVGDASYFTGSGAGVGWQDDYMNASYAAPASALSYAENLVTLDVGPGAAVGAPAEVRTVPGGTSAVATDVRATTVAGSRASITTLRAAYDGPIVVRGQIGTGAAPVRRVVPLGDPEAYAAGALREALEKAGITVTGQVRAVREPTVSPVTGRSVFAPAFGDSVPLRVLAIHDSPPLLEVLEVVNKRSHNLMAEQVLRTVGRVAAGEGSVEAGARAMSVLMEAASGADTLAMADGSGLSVANRVSARTTIHLLSFMRHSPMWDAYWQTLPEAGGPGGLRRMYGTPAAGNLRAKTGTINRVSALSGYVRAANGELLAFSIMANDIPSTWRAKRVEDEIGAALAGFDRGAAPAGSPAATPEAGDTPAPRTAQPAPPTAAPPATTTPPPAAAAPRTHTVRAGDTLDGIARRYGVTVQALQAANPGLNPRRLLPGRTVVKIPGGSATPPASATKTYTVRAGDTLDAIARRNGVTVQALQAANPGLNPRRLIPGRTVVKIPGG